MQCAARHEKRVRTVLQVERERELWKWLQPRTSELPLQWKDHDVYAWQRVAHGGWVRDPAHRGGFQGHRLAPVMFALHLDGTHHQLDLHLARIGVDDTYLAGPRDDPDACLVTGGRKGQP